jgi:hypothetical protein
MVYEASPGTFLVISPDEETGGGKRAPDGPVTEEENEFSNRIRRRGCWPVLRDTSPAVVTDTVRPEGPMSAG